MTRSSRCPACPGEFPTSGDRFRLAYAESVSSIDYFVRTHGQDALVALIGSYADGRTDDEAFEAAIGQDVDAFNAAWLADLGADAADRFGPQPAPRGPLPPGWVGEPRCPDSAERVPSRRPPDDRRRSSPSSRSS